MQSAPTWLAWRLARQAESIGTCISAPLKTPALAEPSRADAAFRHHDLLRRAKHQGAPRAERFDLLRESLQAARGEHHARRLRGEDEVAFGSTRCFVRLDDVRLVHRSVEIQLRMDSRRLTHGVVHLMAADAQIAEFVAHPQVRGMRGIGGERLLAVEDAVEHNIACVAHAARVHPHLQLQHPRDLPRSPSNLLRRNSMARAFSCGDSPRRFHMTMCLIVMGSGRGKAGLLRPQVGEGQHRHGLVQAGLGEGLVTTQRMAAARSLKSMTSRLPIIVLPSSSVSGPAKAMRSATAAR
jgi:hypothetical protein